MNISNLCKQIYSAILITTLSSMACVKAVDNNDDEQFSRSKFIEVGAEYEYSDNIYKIANDEQSGSTVIGDIELGYEQQSDSNTIVLNYYTKYEGQSENALENSSYWIGKSALTQELFSKNILFNLAHSRQRYIIDENKTNLAGNQDERDVVDLGLKWLLPFSQRTTFVFGVAHEEIWFDNSNNNDSNSNTGQTSWQYALSKTMQLQLSYMGSEHKFDGLDSDYRQHNLDAQITGQYRLGTYLLSMGETWIQGSDYDYNGQHYGLSINALMRAHLLQLSASRTLLNSAQQVGEPNELDFSGNSVFWRSKISLDYQYTMLDGRLVSKARLYFSNDDNILMINSGATEDKNRYGTYGELAWSVTKKFSSGISADYYKEELNSGDNKKYTEAKVYGRYNINDSLYIQCSATFEKQTDIQVTPGYQEQHYSTRIAFRY
jgi:hypothetical protein